MTGREKVNAAIAYLEARGVKPLVAAPLGWRLLRRSGVNVPPPLFIGFVPLALLTGLAFGLPFALFGLVFLTLVGAPIHWPVALMGVVGGTVFGLMNAAGTRWKASRLGLPAWSEFDPAGPDGDDAW